MTAMIQQTVHGTKGIEENDEDVGHRVSIVSHLIC